VMAGMVRIAITKLLFCRFYFMMYPFLSKAGYDKPDS